MKTIYILGGGTFTRVRSHLSLGVEVKEDNYQTQYEGTIAVEAWGGTARALKTKFDTQLHELGLDKDYQTQMILTKMADSQNSNIITNDDVDNLVTKLIADSNTKAIIFNIALADFTGTIDDVESGKYAPRLQTKNGKINMALEPTPKLIGKIRKERKDIFVVGFKTTTNESSDTQYLRGLELLKKNSLNLVLANDTGTRNNMIIAPEETRYGETNDRGDILNTLVKMVTSRMQNSFTRSTVVEGQSVAWNSSSVPESLRTVVNHCIESGAYKPFLGKTAGHFAVKVNEGEILTSIRKTNFNQLSQVGMVRVESKNKNEVIAHGFRPSVGGQSQRIIFSEHPELDCIVHFHCPVKEEYREIIPAKEQWPNECGSHECGQNTSRGLQSVDLGDGQSLKVVYLDEHGPNIVFNKNTDSQKVIHFIDKHFDLKAKTGGLVMQ